MLYNLSSAPAGKMEHSGDRYLGNYLLANLRLLEICRIIANLGICSSACVWHGAYSLLKLCFYFWYLSCLKVLFSCWYLSYDQFLFSLSFGQGIRRPLFSLIINNHEFCHKWIFFVIEPFFLSFLHLCKFTCLYALWMRS